MDRHHIARELGHFLDDLERERGVTRREIARRGAYLSHETGTHATPSSSCAANELHALAANFAMDDLRRLVLVNTKALTGHPMGVGVEDALACHVLSHGRKDALPPLPPDTRLDPNLGRLPLRWVGGGASDDDKAAAKGSEENTTTPFVAAARRPKLPNVSRGASSRPENDDDDDDDDDLRYALRFAAGFGSQVAFALYAKV